MSDPMTQHDLRHHETHTDGQEIRNTFGIPGFWKLEEQFADYEHPLPDAIVHTRDGSEWGHPGGTNWLAVGGKGSGKSTLGLWLAAHLMDRNGETVIWRGAEGRSEWLPFKHWATVYLPADCDAQTFWVPEDKDQAVTPEPVNLEEVVASVNYYTGLSDLLSQFDAPEFAVVYPDPEFRDCNRVMRESSYVQSHIEFATTDDAEDPRDATPLIHWWIALAVARIEGLGGHFDWTSLIFDEVADLLPQSARADQYQTYEKLEVMRKVIDESRKYSFSFFAFGQDETNVHEKVRRTFQWRVAMPDEQGNPCKRDGSRAPVGFQTIPMIKNFLNSRGAGYGLCWKPHNFTRFTWQDVPDWEEDTDRVLKIDLDPDPDRTRTRNGVGDGRRGPPGSQRGEVATDD